MVQSIPVGGVHTDEQSVVTDTLTSSHGQNGPAITMVLLSAHAGLTSIVKEQRTGLKQRGLTP